VLSELDAGAAGIDVALADARHRGLAESDPSKDVNGTDAAEKLSILVRHLGGLTLAPSDIPTRGIGDLTGADLHNARTLGGALKPVAAAGWVDDCVTAYVSPAFVPGTHPLAGLSGTENGIQVHGHHLPPVFFSGAGAGPDATAATILDDVVEAVECGRRGTSVSRRSSAWSSRTARPGRLTANWAASWFVRLQSGATLPAAAEIARLFAGYGLWIRRASGVDRRESVETAWLLTHPCDAGCVDAALSALSLASGCRTHRWPSLEDQHG
jgi:homoserine dehydrogenase